MDVRCAPKSGNWQCSKVHCHSITCLQLLRNGQIERLGRVRLNQWAGTITPAALLLVTAPPPFAFKLVRQSLMFENEQSGGSVSFVGFAQYLVFVVAGVE